MTEPRDLPQVMLTRQEAAKMLRLGTTTIDQLIKRGEVPSVLVGGSRRIRMTDLITYINHLQPDQTVDLPQTHRLALVSGQVLVVEQVGLPAGKLMRAAS